MRNSPATVPLCCPAAARRRLLQSALAAALAGLVPGRARAREDVVRIGYLGPLSGPVAAWGQPGLDGSRLWADWVNAAGGLQIGQRRLQVEIRAFDDEYDPALARIGAGRLIRREGVSLLMMLGGDSWPGAAQVVSETGMLATTLMPSDLSPETQTLIAPAEVHPIYNVTGVDWLARNRPWLKSAVICAQDDVFGLPSIATYVAAFRAAGITLTDEPLLFDPATRDFAPLVRRMLAGSGGAGSGGAGIGGQRPDIVCLDTCYPDYILPICEELHRQGFAGQILSCTLDFHDRIIARTSPDFLEGAIFQFPDFDDPALASGAVNFQDPARFHAEYEVRFPGSWSSVSWQYAAVLDLWKAAAEAAGSVAPEAVLAALKSGAELAHVFGPARWWGAELFGIPNALVGNWPVVEITGGRARIREFVSVPDWYDRHGPLLHEEMARYGQLWSQRS
ncbi:ABC transporter substrate-binding protein [Xinfangfangia sp. D13-10-4-6]|uniref:ABC transporter substrate-binding protein n=1 Tax=Pseudogemmobacter hezensis TaxID=2737662 RepID=UPI001554E599|nr:ABC transporter substrate-binding protein [Pseudogemmobacter hezensis]NPD14792.1 ABC transporter substrate-binding protein [Pseudogemmobacter hezensis]